MLYRPVLAGIVVVLALLGVTLAGPAHADPTAGTAGTMTAWNKAQTRVIAVRACRREREREGYDYTSCERGFRMLVVTRLCAREGRGTHTFYRQIGDGPRTKSSVRCDD